MKNDSFIKKDDNSQVIQVNFYLTRIEKNKKNKKVFQNINKNINKNILNILNKKNILFFSSIGLNTFFVWITCLYIFRGFIA